MSRLFGGVIQNGYIEHLPVSDFQYNSILEFF